MPTITKEAEAALMEISRQKSDRITKLERERRAIRQIASNAREEGIRHGAVIWREALEKIIGLTN